MFVNGLTANVKYSGSNMQNFPQQFQTPVSQKQNTFSGLFNEFLEYAWNVEHFEKKDEDPSPIISKIIYAKRRG